VAAYRVLVQKRPLTGPEARHFPSRGFGVAKMRERLRLLGIDPDRVHTSNPVLQRPAPEQTHEEVVDQLEKLRDLRDHGTITEEEYERARERLRRY